ncbi:hypothetical protein F0U61_52820 [Archangium violaceum]|uniref:hypothetical protein n=1 Tax=Archangium violaceum TaxID=83451 RepID=UPI002B2D3CDC|nr:hypothetical protein F0U61_52820 [Archangium violaceum]
MNPLKKSLPLCALLALAACGPFEDEAPVSRDDISTREQEALSACQAPANAKCWAMLPTDTNFGGRTTAWNRPHYALRPNTPTKSNLVVMLHGAGSSAGNFYHINEHTTAQTSFFASAVNKGYRVVGITHRNSPNIREVCGTNVECHLPTRRTFITGVVQPGSAVTDMGYYDGIEARLIRLLVFMRDSQDPAGGWGAYLTPSNCTGTKNTAIPCDIVWNKLIVAGHSQGAGHAAVIGKDHPVDTVVMLAGPTDRTPAQTVPSYTLASSGLATPAGGGNYRGLVHTQDSFLTASTTHWGSTRLNAGTYGKTTSSADVRCIESPHTCVIDSDSFYTTWQGFWP